MCPKSNRPQTVHFPKPSKTQPSPKKVNFCEDATGAKRITRKISPGARGVNGERKMGWPLLHLLVAPLKNQRAEHFQRGLERVSCPWANFNFGLGRPESPLFLEGGRAGGGRDCPGRKAKLAPLCPYSKLDSARCFNWLANKKYAQKTIRTPMVFLMVDASTLPLLMHEVA